MNCYGPIYGDCDKEAIATVDTESWLSFRELCEEHTEEVKTGDCGDAWIDYEDGRRVVVKIEYDENDNRQVILK